MLAAPSQALDVTDRLELLGNPTEGQYSTRPYAQNVWDMEVYNNRIYLGSGNSSNKGPSRNAGPAHVYYYDTVSSQFGDQFTTNDEQIERYVKLRDRLCLPGHDPKGSTPASIYCLGDTQIWQRTAIDGVHIFDLEEYNNQVWVGRGVFAYQNQALASVDATSFFSSNAPTWTYSAVPSSGIYTWRLYNFFRLGETLMASGEPSLGSSQPGLFSYSSATNQWTQVNNASRFFPGASTSIPKKKYTIRRDAVLNGTLLYIGSRIYNDQQHFPFALYRRATNTSLAVQIPLEAGFLPLDVMVKDGLALVLATRQEAPDRFTNRVYQSTDLVNWSTVFDFERPSFARSFEWVNGDFYFGMGIEWSDESQTSNFTFIGIPEESGNIYRVKGEFFRLQKSLRRSR
jgi:hypothetical protein